LELRTPMMEGKDPGSVTLSLFERFQVWRDSLVLLCKSRPCFQRGFQSTESMLYCESL